MSTKSFSSHPSMWSARVLLLLLCFLFRIHRSLSWEDTSPEFELETGRNGNLRRLQRCIDVPILDLNNETVLVGFVGVSQRVTEDDFDSLVKLFLVSYNDLTEPLCEAESFRQVTNVVITAEAQNVTAEVPSQPTGDSFFYRYDVSSRCRACLDPRVGLFSNGTTTIPERSPCPPCTAPTLEAFLREMQINFRISKATGEFLSIQELVSVTPFVDINCAEQESVFETDVIVDFVGDPNAVTPEQLSAFESGFADTYNNLNAFDPTTCDPLFREVTEVEVFSVAPTYNRRLAEDANPLFIHPGFFGQSCLSCSAVQIDFVYLIRVRGNCRGCARETDLFDEGNATSTAMGRRRDLQSIRRLQPTDQCTCPADAMAFRAPTRSEFRVALNSTIQNLVREGTLTFIATTQQVVEIDQVACDETVSSFVSTVAINAFGVPSEINRLDSTDLGTAFLSTYNGLARGLCDPLFRTILSSRLVDVADDMPDSTVPRNFMMRFQVNGRCRGCGPGTDLFAAQRRWLQETTKGKGRRLDLADACFCDTNSFLIRRPPTLMEFEVAFMDAVSLLQIPSVATIQQIEDTTEGTPGPEDWVQLGQTLVGDANSDRFGFSVCLSADGLTMGVGATQNGGGGLNAGLMRVYAYSPQAAAWTQLGRDLFGQVGDRAGSDCSMAANGDTVAFYSALGRRVVDVYAYNTALFVWEQLGSSIEGVSGGEYPVSLSADGRTMAVGLSSMNRVRIYAYQIGAGDWEQVAQEIRGERDSEFSGGAVALSSDGLSVIIGAIGNDDAGRDAGHVRIYTFSPSLLRWVQLGPDIDGDSAGDSFGFSVAISADGRTVAVGAPAYSGGETQTAIGQVKVFGYSENEDSWLQLGQALDGDFSQDQSGEIVSLSSDGRTVAVGAYWFDSVVNRGQVRLFVYVDAINAWLQRGSAITGDADGDIAGHGLAISADGRIVAVGAPQNGVRSLENPGLVKTYQWNFRANPEVSPASTPYPTPSPTTPMPSGLDWIQVGADIVGEDVDDRFGISTCMSRDGLTVAAGGNFNDAGGNNAGYLRVLRFSTSSMTWNQRGQDIDGMAGDQFGTSCSLSDDGQILALLAPFRLEAYVFAYNSDFNVWTQRGQTLAGVSGEYPLSLSSNGLRIALGARHSNRARVMDYVSRTAQWIQVGQDIIGQDSSEFAGTAVVLSSDGLTVAIGSIGNDDAGLDAGHVRVFVFSPALSRWTQLAQNFEIDGQAARDSFGFSLAMSQDGRTLAVGAPTSSASLDPASNPNVGYVKVFTYLQNSAIWTQLGQEIEGSAAQDRAGTSVALSSDGRTLAVGAPFQAGDSVPNLGVSTNAGRVRVFGYIEEMQTWIQRGSDLQGQTGDQAGTGLAISGDGRTVAIGSPLNNNDGRYDAGRVQVFAWQYNLIPAPAPAITPRPTTAPSASTPTVADWTQLGQDIDGEVGLDRFGTAVCMSSDGLTVAASAIENNGGGTDSGHLRVFVFSTQRLAWVQLGQDIDGAELDRFGASCTMSANGRRVALLAPFRQWAVVFSYNPLTSQWEQTGPTLTNVGGSGNEKVSLSNDGNVMALGNSATGTVTVVAYRPQTNLWDPVGEFNAQFQSDLYGSSVALSGDGSTVAVGAPGNDAGGIDAGCVQVYRFEDDGWLQLGEKILGRAPADNFGWVVALSANGSILASGAPLKDADTNPVSPNVGQVRVLEIRGRQWFQLGLDFEGRTSNERIGETLALSDDGSTVAISSRHHGDNRGRVQLYRYNAQVEPMGLWVQLGLDIEGEFPRDQSGTSVALSANGRTVAIGAPLNNNDGRNDAGQVRVFQYLFSDV